MDNLRGLLSIRRVDRVPNARIREFCGGKKGLDERTDEGVSGGLTMYRGWRVIRLPRESI